MLRTRWAPWGTSVWNELQQLQHDLNQAFDRWNEPGAGPGWSAFPALRVWEQDHDLYVEAELPGVELDQLEIFVTGGNQLTIKGGRRLPTVDKATEHRQERLVGSFVRSLTLPAPVDDAKVEAKLEHGVLTLKLPKQEEAKPRRITIKAN